MNGLVDGWVGGHSMSHSLCRVADRSSIDVQEQDVPHVILIPSQTLYLCSGVPERTMYWGGGATCTVFLLQLLLVTLHSCSGQVTKRW